MVVYFGSVLLGVVFFQPLGGIFDRFDTLRLRWIASLRNDSLTDVVLFVNLLASRWTIRALRWGTIAALVGFRRWRHLFVFLGSMLAAELVAYQISVLSGTKPAARHHDHRAVGAGIRCPPGRWWGWPPRSSASRTRWSFRVVPARYRSGSWAAVILGLVFARLYLAVDHPSDAGFGAILGVAIPLVAFRWFTPNEVFPVTLPEREGGPPRRRAASGARPSGAPSRTSSGYEVLQIKPVGLEGSGGSTPLRLRVGPGATRTVPVRQALREEPRPGGPLVQAGPHHPVRRARGRDPVPDRSAGSSSTRTTRCACSTTTGFPPPSPTASSRSRRSAST